MEKMDIYSATQSIKAFSTGIFPGHWFEMSKSRLYDVDISATWTLHRIKRYIDGLSPVCPFFRLSFNYSLRIQRRRYQKIP